MSKKNVLLILIFSLLFFSAFTLPSCVQQKNAGIWRSDDGGETWAWKVTINAKQNIGSFNILQFVFDPTNPAKIYLGTQGRGMYVSDNNGDAWTPTKITTTDVWSIAPDTDPNIIYVAGLTNGSGQVYATTDAGQNWQAIFSDVTGLPVYNVIIDWFNHDHLLITTGWGGVLESNDRGKTWTKLFEFPKEAAAGRIYVSTKDSRLMWYVTPTTGIFETSDGGSSWNEIALENLKKINPSAAQIYQLTIDPKNTTFYLATNYGLLLSNDQGRSWNLIKTLTPLGILPFYSVAINPIDSKEIFFVADNNVYQSVNEGESWHVRKVYTGQFIRTLKYSPTDPQKIFLGIRSPK